MGGLEFGTSLVGATGVGFIIGAVELVLTGFSLTLHSASAEIPRQSDFDGSFVVEGWGAVEVLGWLDFCRGLFDDEKHDNGGSGGGGGGGIALLFCTTVAVDVLDFIESAVCFS